MSRAPRTRRRWPWIAGAGLLGGALLLVLVVVPALLPGAVVYAPNAQRPASPPGPEEAAAARAAGARALRVPVGPPPASLAAWVVEPAAPAAAPRGTVLVLHGIRDRMTSMRGWARRLSQRGYRTVLVDLRGHGRSGGRYLTYGVVERRDLQQLLDHLADQGQLAAPVGLLGISYGAATAIQLAGLDRRVRAVVAIAPFRSLRAVVPLYVRRLLPGLGALISTARIQAGVDEAGRLAGFDPDLAAPELAITRTAAQVLLLHGTADRHIPISHSEAICRAAPGRCKLVPVAGEDHDSIAGDRRGIVGREALGWLARWLAGGAT